MTSMLESVRPAPHPLGRFRRIERADLDSFAETARDWLTPCTVSRVGGSGHAPVATMAATTVGPFKLVYAHTAGAELAVDYVQQEANYVVSLALDGHNHVSVGKDEALCAERSAVILSPQMVAAMRISDGYQQLHIGVPRAALERHLEGMIGRPVTKPIRFRMDMDLARPALRSWVRGVQLLVDDLESDDGLAGSDPSADPWSDFLMTGLLLAQPHNYSEFLHADRPSVFQPLALRRALDLIEADVAGDLSLARLCEAAGVGPRALQRYFHEHLGSSPREYVQAARLERAHRDLTCGAGQTVAEIAHRWGFTHAPRFAGAYQERYGVSPSVSLRAAR